MRNHAGVSSLRLTIAVFVVAVGIGYYWCCREQPQATCSPKKLMIALLGAPGSGKGTLAERAAKELGFVVLSTGNLIRENLANNTEIGKQIKECTGLGKLVPDEIVFSMVKEWLSIQRNAGKSIILDGFPRTATQAALLNDLLKTEFSDYALHLITIDVPEHEVIQRIANRLICENKACQSTCRKEQFEDPGHAQCPHCGGKLIRREDDREEAVKERLLVYAKANAPMLDYYRITGVQLETIHGGGKSIDEVFNDFRMTIG